MQTLSSNRDSPFVHSLLTDLAIVLGLGLDQRPRGLGHSRRGRESALGERRAQLDAVRPALPGGRNRSQVVDAHLHLLERVVNCSQGGPTIGRHPIPIDPSIASEAIFIDMPAQKALLKEPSEVGVQQGLRKK